MAGTRKVQRIEVEERVADCSEARSWERRSWAKRKQKLNKPLMLKTS